MKVLVTAASRHGSTAEIARSVARHLADGGHDVEYRRVEEVDDLTGFDAVVLGSAIYAGRWLKSGYDFVERLAPELAVREVWLFSSGPLGDPPMPSQDVDISGVMVTTGARGHAVFPGCLDKHKLAYAERAVARALHAPVGDFRNWEAVARWSHHVAAEMSS